MKILLDACVLYPSVMRAMLMEVAREGLYTPQWSDRILEEWRRATAKLGPVAQMQAEGEIVVLRSQWPTANVAAHQGLEARLWLPDPNDIHVLAAAISGSCDAVMTVNTKDFPRNILAEEGLKRIEPDGFLAALTLDHSAAMQAAGARVLTAANAQGEGWSLRALLKKARLPRTAKALSRDD